jgi:hypothetical protein
MMKEDVKHIFDRSACLNKRQIEAYLSGNMITEEVYAIEHHINGCPLCSMALDGIQQRTDALEVIGQLNSDFLKDHFAVMPEPASSGAAAYVKNLKPKAVAAAAASSGSGAGTAIKLAVGIAACIGILWFIQNAGKDKQTEKQVAATEQSVNETPVEEQSVIVEEPLLADTQVVVAEEPPVETRLEDEAAAAKVAVGPPENKKPEVVARPAVTTKPATTQTAKITVPPPPKATTAKVPPPKTPVAPQKTAPVALAKPLPPPSPKEIAREQPKPQPARQEPAPEPKVERQEPKEEPKPAAKKEESEELPSDPIAAGKALMDKRNYNAAINKMRNEMRSNNKSRRQEAVMLVAKCYQQMGNKDRAKELLTSLVDEGGKEKKAAKKALKEVDKEEKAE